MADLQIFPVAVPGGINQSSNIPTETDLEECKNFFPYRGRLGLRGPISLVATVQDDQGSPANVSAILDLCEHSGQTWILSWSSVTQKVYLHRMDYSGSSLTRVANVYTGVASRPFLTLTSFEGGTAEAGTSRIYIADYAQTLTTKYWDGSALQSATADLDNSGVAENLNFALMIDYKFCLWGTSFYETTITRPEMLRFSQPGLVPCTDPAGGANPKEWVSSDFRNVGRRGDKIRALAKCGDRLLVFQKDMSHAIFGSGATTWTRQELSPTIGAVGPGAVCSADNRVVYLWSSTGPYRTDGSEMQFIGEAIQEWITDVDASELGTRVAYSPDTGLVHFIVSLTGADQYSLSLTFDHRAGRWVRAAWLVGTSTELEIGAIQALPRS